MKITNPTKDSVSIIFKGEKFTVEAGASITVSDTVGTFWKKVHTFLIVEGSEKKNIEEKIDEVLKSVKEKAEDVVEDEVSEPKSSRVLGKK